MTAMASGPSRRGSGASREGHQQQQHPAVTGKSAQLDHSHGHGADGEIECNCPPQVGPHRASRELTESDRVLLHRLSSALSAGHHGTVHLRTEPHFLSQTRLFNRAIVSPAIALVKPLDTRGVQLAVRTAREGGWSVSVKAGGYGTTGWATQGDLVIDLSRLNDIQLHLPDAELGLVQPPDFVVDLDSSVVDAEGGAGKRSAVEAFGGAVGAPRFTTRSRRDEEETAGGKGPASPSGSGHSSSDDCKGGSGSSSGSDSRQSDPLSTESSTTPPSAPAEDSKADKDHAREEASPTVDGERSVSAPEPPVPATEESKGRPRFARTSVSEPARPSGEEAGGPASGSTGRTTPSASMPSSSALGEGRYGLDASAFQQPPQFFFPGHDMPPVPPTSSAYPFASTSSSAVTPPLAGPTAGHPGFTGMLSDVPALVTFGAGIKAQELDTRTGQQGYHVPLSAYPVGGAIFATGGFGFLSRLKGLSMDNVVCVEMVLSDGRVVNLTEDFAPGSEEEEMWWAFRGAGTALGVVTKVRAKAWKVGLVHAANMIYPFNPVTSPSLIRHWRDCLKNVPAELYANLILTAGPRAESSVVVIQLCYFGSQADGERYVSAITAWEGERPLLQDVAMCTLLSQQDKVALVLDSSRPHSGNRWCIRSDLMSSLTDQTIHDTCRQFMDIPERSAWLFEIAGRAVGDIDPSLSCFPRANREAAFQVAAIHQWGEQSEDTAWANAAARWIDNTISPHSPGGPYPCFLETRTERARFVRTFGGREGWERLRRVKRKLDPTGTFEYSLWPEADTHAIRDEVARAATEGVVNGI